MRSGPNGNGYRQGKVMVTMPCDIKQHLSEMSKSEVRSNSNMIVYLIEKEFKKRSPKKPIE